MDFGENDWWRVPVFPIRVMPYDSASSEDFLGIVCHNSMSLFRRMTRNPEESMRRIAAIPNRRCTTDATIPVARISEAHISPLGDTIGNGIISRNRVKDIFEISIGVVDRAVRCSDGIHPLENDGFVVLSCGTSWSAEGVYVSYEEVTCVCWGAYEDFDLVEDYLGRCREITRSVGAGSGIIIDSKEHGV